MVGSATIATDTSVLSKLDRLLFRLESFFAVLGGLAILTLIMLAVISVGGSNIFNRPLLGYVDWVEQTMPLIAFLAISSAQRSGSHIRMDMFLAQFQGRLLYAFELITTLLILALVVFLLWGSFSHFLRSFDLSAPLWSRDSSMDIALPLWPAKLVVPLAFSVLFLRLVLQVWGFLRALIYGEKTPVAVPLSQDAAAEAKSQSELYKDGTN